MIYPVLPKQCLSFLFVLPILSCNCSFVLAETHQINSLIDQPIQLTGSIPDLRNEYNIITKKHKFFQALMPMVEAENNRIIKQRAFLLNLQQKSVLSVTNQNHLISLLNTYRLEQNYDGAVPWNSLLERVDTVPVALILSQAANESAWGTSRFAREGNNLFGQWCFFKGCGIIPKRRNLGATHEVASFKSVQASVRSYLHNLNTGYAYAYLRRIRAQKRVAGEVATATQLAEGLSKYSERGQEYVSTIQPMIKYNKKYMYGKGEIIR